MRHWCVRRRGSRSNTFIKYSDLMTKPAGLRKIHETIPFRFRYTL